MQMSWKMIVVLAVLGSVSVLVTVIDRPPSATMPESVSESIDNEVVLLDRANRGDVKAALELSEAYSFIDSTRERSIAVLRKALPTGDVKIETQLGGMLINEVLGQHRSGKIVDTGQLEEAISLLNSAKSKGSADAAMDLKTAAQLLGDSFPGKR